MKTSPTTSREERTRAALLDVLHAQWRELGVPFQAPAFEHPLEVIDPEALLWCSLHFFGSEPRLEFGEAGGDLTEPGVGDGHQALSASSTALTRASTSA